MFLSWRRITQAWARAQLGMGRRRNAEQRQGERAADQGRAEGILAEMFEAHPDRGGRGELGVAAADPAKGEKGECDDEDDRFPQARCQPMVAMRQTEQQRKQDEGHDETTEIQFEIVIVKMSEKAA